MTTDVRSLHGDDLPIYPNELGHRVGDWDVWELDGDKIRPESWGWSVTISAPPANRRPIGSPISTATGGFVHSSAEAETQVRQTLQAYGLTGQRVHR